MALNSYNKETLNRESFLKDLERDGYALVEDVYSRSFVESIVPELRSAIQNETEQFHSADHKDYGMLLACPVYGGKFLEVLENPDYYTPFNWILGETCIIWVYTSSCIAPGKGNYASRIHVDRPFFIRDFQEGVGSLILLSDFTEENGATWILPGSHRSPDEPDPDYFFSNAVRIIAKKGSVFYFNLRLWHAGGINQTDAWRDALGIGMIRPYIKQRIDLPRAMAHLDTASLADQVKQKLGFFAQSPVSLEEYYGRAAMLESFQPSEWKKADSKK
jgi:Phytanoyl-CoA dioxygenase (PhyH)